MCADSASSGSTSWSRTQGWASVRTLEAQSLDEFDRHYAINVRTPYFLVQQCLPFLGEGSRVIFVSSTTARSAPVGASLYASTKGAINTLVRCLAGELGPRGIRVNAVAPGAIETDMASFLKIEAARQAVITEQALKRVGQPADVADAILVLASSESRWMTGQVSRSVAERGSSRYRGRGADSRNATTDLRSRAAATFAISAATGPAMAVEYGGECCFARES